MWSENCYLAKMRGMLLANMVVEGRGGGADPSIQHVTYTEGLDRKLGTMFCYQLPTGVQVRICEHWFMNSSFLGLKMIVFCDLPL